MRKIAKDRRKKLFGTEVNVYKKPTFIGRLFPVYPTILVG